MLAELRRAAVRRGVMGGSWQWLAFGAVVWGAWALRYATRKQSPAVWTGVVRDGEVLEVVAVTAKDRRRARRSGSAGGAD
jgi:hypothetical protein